MGLDWMLQKTKARPGSESRFAQLTLEMDKISRHAKSQEEYEELTRDLSEELAGISVHAFDVIGAPRLGHDEKADNWFFENVYKPNHEEAISRDGSGLTGWAALWSKPFDAIVEKYKGQYILEAAEEEGGCAAVSGMLCSAADFRGKMLRFCEGLPSELVDESYEDHTGEQSLEYADRLERAIALVEDEEGRGTVRDAVAWLRFWGSKGFGYNAWY